MPDTAVNANDLPMSIAIGASTFVFIESTEPIARLYVEAGSEEEVAALARATRELVAE